MTRPTADRVKESLFNIISAYISDANVLDLYAGTGSLGIEALSRGAESAVFIDKSREAIEVIEENLLHTKLFDKSTVIFDDVNRAIEKLYSVGRKFDIIFIDPPYSKDFVAVSMQQIVKTSLIKEEGLVLVEHHKEDSLSDEYGNLKLKRIEKYGDTRISFYNYACIEKE